MRAFRALASRGPRLASSVRGLALVAAAFVGASACSSSAAPDGASGDAGVVDDAASFVDPVDAADGAPPLGTCAATFGSGLTAGFGRLDGVVYAVQKPSDTACVLPNSDHVVVQVLMNGAVYRMVVNVQSDRAGADPKIRVAAMPHALPAPAYAEGWHLGAPLDYVTTLGAHADGSFSALSLDEAVARIVSEVKVGAAIAVYAESGAGKPDSAHLVHRNKTNADGALVVDPTTTPRFVLFHFDDQTF